MLSIQQEQLPAVLGGVQPKLHAAFTRREPNARDFAARLPRRHTSKELLPSLYVQPQQSAAERK
jgi:hypothetical protein